VIFSKSESNLFDLDANAGFGNQVSNVTKLFFLRIWWTYKIS